MCVNENKDFSVEILADLITQGYSGKELLDKFIEMKNKIRPAVKRMIKEADELIHDESSRCPLDDLFTIEDNPDLPPKFIKNCLLAKEEIKQGHMSDFSFRNND